MVTELGEQLRSIRAQRSEYLMDMAKKVGLSPAMLSSVETGARKAPKGFIEKIGTLYQLTPAQVEELHRARALSDKSVTVDLKGLSPEDKDLVISFARRLPTLDERSKFTIAHTLAHMEADAEKQR